MTFFVSARAQIDHRSDASCLTLDEQEGTSRSLDLRLFDGATDYFDDDTGAGVGFSTYSLRAHTDMFARATLTSTCRRRFVRSGFFE